VYSWGDCTYGQCGDGTSGSSNYKGTPLSVTAISAALQGDRIVQVSAGLGHSIAIGTTVSWIVYVL
jgi:alpha-tubulin suppressor-like RCC1 family protein